MAPAWPICAVADDLTGALDSTVAFANRGLRVAVATRPGALDEAMGNPWDVIAVNSDTRDASPEDAAAIVFRLGRDLAKAGGLIIKKIDSRLKGNICVETAALLRATGRTRLIVSPAVPALGRFVRGGCMVGAGIAEPLPIAAILPRCDGVARINDIARNEDLAAIAAELVASRHDTIGVGAAGLTSAIARHLGPTPAAVDPTIPLAGPVLFLIGSRDPVTMRQIAFVRRHRPDIAYVRSTGEGDDPPGGPGHLLVHGVGGQGASPSREVAQRLGERGALLLKTGRFAAVVACGGDTAACLVKAVEARVLRPRTEPLPGVPTCRIDLGGEAVTLLTKSGGFGGPDTLGQMAAGRDAWLRPS